MKKIYAAALVSSLVLSSACTKAEKAQDMQSDVDVAAINESSDVNADQSLANDDMGNATASASYANDDVDLNGLVTLKDTINMTLRRHHTLKIIRANLDAAKHEVQRSKAGWGPSLDLSADFGFSRVEPEDTNAGASGMSPSGSVSLLITQPLWDGYATSSRVKAGEATVDSLKARVFDNATTFALDSIIAHIDVIRRRAIVELAKTNVEAHQRILASQRERVSLGAAPSSDVTQTQGRLMGARASLAQNIEALEAANSQYQRLTGVYPPANLEPVELPANLFAGPDEAFQQAKVTNPKIVAYLYDVDTAKYNKELAKAPFHPQLNLQAGPSYYERGTNGTNSELEKSFDVRLNMDWNLFNSFADKNAVRAANSRVVESRQTALNFLDELQKEIQDTYSQYFSSIEQQGFYEQAKVYNRETRVAYLEQFALGTRSLSDILDIESEFYSSSTEELTAKGNITVGAYRIIALGGTLIPDLNIDPKYFETMNIKDFEEEGIDF